MTDKDEPMMGFARGSTYPTRYHALPADADVRDITTGGKGERNGLRRRTRIPFQQAHE